MLRTVVRWEAYMICDDDQGCGSARCQVQKVRVLLYPEKNLDQKARESVRSPKESFSDVWTSVQSAVNEAAS